MVNRCNWCLGDDQYIRYHDEEWGFPVYDPQTLFEFLILEGAQAGLSWLTVLRKRENYRQVLDQFNPEKIACYGAAKKAELLENKGIIRNRLKVESVIRNARAYLEVEESGGSFGELIWSFVDGQPIQNNWKSLQDVPSSTPESDVMSRELKRLGFNFVGSTICYAFMQATGMVNDHLADCYRYQACKDQADINRVQH
jgi:DNA-3-methyladenine glycosylase I